MTFLAALRHDRIDAPWVVDGPINGELFQLYVRQILVRHSLPETLSCSIISVPTNRMP